MQKHSVSPQVGQVEQGGQMASFGVSGIELADLGMQIIGKPGVHDLLVFNHLGISGAGAIGLGVEVAQNVHDIPNGEEVGQMRSIVKGALRSYITSEVHHVGGVFGPGWIPVVIGLDGWIIVDGAEAIGNAGPVGVGVLARVVKDTDQARVRWAVAPFTPGRIFLVNEGVRFVPEVADLVNAALGLYGRVHLQELFARMNVRCFPTGGSDPNHGCMASLGGSDGEMNPPIKTERQHK